MKFVLLLFIALTSIQAGANDLLGGTMEGCPPGARNCSHGNNGTLPDGGGAIAPKSYTCELRGRKVTDHELATQRLAQSSVTADGSLEISTSSFAADAVAVTVETIGNIVTRIRLRHADLDAESCAINLKGSDTGDAGTPTVNLVDLRAGKVYEANCFVPLVLNPVPSRRSRQVQ